MSEDENEKYRSKLNPMQYAVTREKGTEPPFTGLYHNCKTPGVYNCVCCDVPLFHSKDKFDSGTGWPSYFRPVSSTSIREIDDHSLGMKRTEVVCAHCDAHLGHVFPDGPQEETGMRYCINSASLDLKEDQE